MSVDTYEELRAHIGHDVRCVCYGKGSDPDPANVAIECETCGVVLMDFDYPGDDREVTITLTMTEKEWAELAHAPESKAASIEAGHYDGFMDPADEKVHNQRWVRYLRAVGEKVKNACIAHEVRL